MANLRAEALKAQLAGLSPAPEAQPELEESAAPEGDPVMEAMALLEPVAADNPKVQRALDLLRQASGQEENVEEDVAPSEFEEGPEEE